MKYIMGIDVGGTSVKIGQFKENLTLVDKWEIPTNKEEQGIKILEDIVQSIKSKIDLEEILGYGFGVPGPVSGKVVIECVNLGWPSNYPLVDIVESLTGNANIYVENDANVATLGELSKGAAKEFHSAVMLTLGTGIGGGIVVNDAIISGANGAAGEFGHIQVERDHGFPCNCGSTGCLETVASASGIKSLYQKYKVEQPFKGVKDLLDPSAKAIMDLAVKGDALASYTIDQVASYLGYASHLVAMSVNPEVIIFGGGVSKAGDFLLDKIREAYAMYPFKATKNMKFLLATLGNDAGIYGAAGLVKSHG